MRIGMLWFSNDPKQTIDFKIKEAASYYSQKYGQKPNVCFVHTSMMEGGKTVGEIKVETTSNVLPNHFWIGVRQGGEK